MINWSDPQIIEDCSDRFIDLTFLLLGLYGWQYLQSFQLENALLRRQVTLHWPMLSYLTGRIFCLVTVTLSAILSELVEPHIDCGCVLKFFAFSDTVVIACASTNLVIRTWVIWRDNRLVLMLLACLILGHWFALTLSSAGMQVTSSSGACGFLLVNRMYATATAMYTMLFNFGLVVLMILGLLRSASSSSSSPSTSSSLSLASSSSLVFSFSRWECLRGQGIIYFFIAFLASLIHLVFTWLNLNYVMNIFFAPTTACVMTIASNHAISPLFDIPSCSNSNSSATATTPPPLPPPPPPPHGPSVVGPDRAEFEKGNVSHV